MRILRRKKLDCFVTFFGLWYHQDSKSKSNGPKKILCFCDSRSIKFAKQLKIVPGINGATINTHSPKRALAKSDTKTVIMMLRYPFCAGRIFWPPPVLRSSMRSFFHRFNGWFGLVEIVGNSTIPKQESSPKGLWRSEYYKPPGTRNLEHIYIYTV